MKRYTYAATELESKLYETDSVRVLLQDRVSRFIPQGDNYPLAGCSAMALGSSKWSVMMVVTKFPSRSDMHIELVPVSVQ